MTLLFLPMLILKAEYELTGYVPASGSDPEVSVEAWERPHCCIVNGWTAWNQE